MAVYGRNNKKRKRVSLPLDILVFSSDDEEANTDTSKNASKLSQVIQETTIKRPLQDGLLPSASIYSNMERSPKKLPRKSPSKVDEKLIEDHLTTSPKRYTRVIKSIMDSPIGRSTLPKKSPTRKVQPQEKIRKLMAPLSSPKTQTSRLVSLQSTPKTTPHEKDAWNDLFDNIETIKPKIEKLGVYYRADDSEEYEEGENTKEEPLINYIDLDRIYESLNQEVKQESKPTPRTPTKTNIIHHNRTYGDQRSYLLEQEVSEPEEEHQVMNKEMISNYYDYADSNRDTMNINDLRNLGKKNSDKDELEYLLEGLILVGGDIIENCNQVLINSLTDLNNFNLEFLIRNSRQVIGRLNKLMTKITKLENSSGKNLIKYLIQKNMSWLLNKHREMTSDINDENINLLFEGTCAFKIDDLQVLNNTKSNINNFVTNLGEVNVTSLLFDEERIYNSQVFKMMKCQAHLNVKYFENYYQRHSTHLVSEILSLLNECFENITNFKITENEMIIVKILVIVSTSGNQYNNSYIEPLIRLINYNYATIINGMENDTMMNTSLFAMGYIINIIENDKNIGLSNIELLKFTFENIQLINPDKELIDHLVGYSCIILSTYIEELNIPRPQIMGYLKKFQSKIKNSIIEERVKFLLEEITE